MLAFLNKFLTGFYNPDNVDFLAYLAVIGMIPLDPTPTGIWLYKAFKKWWTKEDVYIYIYIYILKYLFCHYKKTSMIYQPFIVNASGTSHVCVCGWVEGGTPPLFKKLVGKTEVLFGKNNQL